MHKTRGLESFQSICLILILAHFLTSCTPRFQPAAPSLATAQLLADAYITADNARLPLKSWNSKQVPVKAVIIALHGFNDYSHFFQQAGRYFSEQHIIAYAYDQRGFGNSPHRGLWAGIDTYVEDLYQFIQLVHDKHPETPVYVLGHSMGAAIALSAMARPQHPSIAGMILAAPAVWSRESMPWYQNLLLSTLSHTLPWMTVTGEGLEITPSDNIKMLQKLGQDPLIIKETRVDTIYGLANLMDQAYSSATFIADTTLVLYGEKDEVVPKQPAYQFLKNIPVNAHHTTIAIYKNGYHMLLRDLQAKILWHDIAVWIHSFSQPLPSGADKYAQQILNTD